MYHELMMRVYHEPRTTIILIICTCGPMGKKAKSCQSSIHIPPLHSERLPFSHPSRRLKVFFSEMIKYKIFDPKNYRSRWWQTNHTKTGGLSERLKPEC